jgi:hypothetical protein
MPNTINRYQIAKARKIAAYLQASADATMEATSAPMLAKCVAIMSADEWRTISFAAGVANADIEAKAAVLAMLRGRTIHAV